MRKVDAINHVFPKVYWDRMRTQIDRKSALTDDVRLGPALMDLDARFRLMDMFDGYEQILALTAPPLEALFTPEVAIDMARLANDGMAEIVALHPDRFPGFLASLPMATSDAAVAEIYRAVKDLGALGVQIFTNVNGRALDLAEYFPIFHACYTLDVPMVMHPVQGGEMSKHVNEVRAQYGIWMTLGEPFETTVAQARLVFSGLMDKLPGIKILTHRMGEMMPMVTDRSATDQPAFGRVTDFERRPKRLKKPHAEYFKDFYTDTMLCGTRETIERGLAHYPRDRILFASGAAIDDEKDADRIGSRIALIDSLEIDPAWKEDIYWRNAAKIMNFDRRHEIIPKRIRA